MRLLTPLFFVVACSDPSPPGTDGGAPDSSIDVSMDQSDGDFVDASPDARDVIFPDVPAVTQTAELWYAVDTLLVHIALDPADGSVSDVHSSTLSELLPLGQNGLTMLEDGSLFGSRLAMDTEETTLYLIDDPPRDGGEARVTLLGTMPDGLKIEGLYSDCEGRVYAMDTGEDVTDSVGNRLLRFTGDVRAGELDYVVVSDLASADVADIDDMGPSILDNTIRDNPGFAIDTGEIHDFNYETGSGTMVGSGGSFGIHALGGALFDDERARLFVFDTDANLFEVDPVSFESSDALTQGPMPSEGRAGWSGLTGPLTECESGFELI